MPRNRKNSEYYFWYTWPLCPNPKYPEYERPDHPHYGKTFQAQLLMWSVETNSIRIRLYDDSGLVAGNVDASADQWVRHLKQMNSEDHP